MFTARMRGLERATHALRDAADDGADDGMARASALVAAQARARHTFTNRTRTLEGSIHHVEPQGRLRDGTLTGGVAADADYASYVDALDGYAFLLPAFVARQSEAARVMDLALQRAVNGVR